MKKKKEIVLCPDSAGGGICIGKKCPSYNRCFGDKRKVKCEK